WVISSLTDPQTGVLGDAKEITAVGHRVVHGGERFTQSVVIDDSVLTAIRDCCQLAPLHNPPNLTGIESCQRLFPNAPQVAVFDTAFFATLPRHAYLYALPLYYYERFGLRRYGFHGTSHRFVASRLRELNGGKPYGRAITCHLGNGCSMTALADGNAVENSLGFTPLEGLVMGTRSGDIDPAIIEFLCEREGKTVQEVTQFLNKECGLAGVSGIGNDVRDILRAAGEGNDNARLALDLFCYRIRKYLGAYAAAMGGLDAVAFTGGIGTHSAPIRKQICEHLSFLGISLDPAQNESAQADRLISDPAARVRVFALETNEELMIARDTRDLVSR
ncbi:MAG: acetate kinase, partial [Armatimonadetes bacterium]|nr:acetate kinase [Armatimonadota bacterium]